MYPYSYGDDLTPEQARSNIKNALKKTGIYTGVFFLGVGMAVAKETIINPAPNPGPPGPPGAPGNGVRPSPSPVGKKASETALVGLAAAIATKTCESPASIKMAIVCGVAVGFFISRFYPSAIYD